MNEKLKVLNELQIVDYSSAGGECEYVLVQDNDENRKKLLDCGFTEDQLSESKIDADSAELDVAYLAFSYGGANWFIWGNGFVIDDE